MSTREGTRIELSRQKAGAIPTIAPDIQIATELAASASAVDKAAREEVVFDPRLGKFKEKVDMGTRAVYGTLPANAKILNFSQAFEVEPPPP